MRVLIVLALILFSPIFLACDGSDEVFEEVNKLRGLGVGISPLVATPSTKAAPQVVTLTVYAAVPKGQTITAESFEDEPNPLTPQVSGLTLVKGSEAYRDFDKLRLYTVQATFTVPLAEQLKPIMREGAVNVRYGIKLISGSEEEKIVGKVVVIDPDSDIGKQSWKDVKFEIVTPQTSGVISKSGKVDIKGKVTNENSEDVKIGWFVSGGKLKNRRARETVWETSDHNKQLLIGTLRGTRSHAFALDVKEFSAE